MALRQAQDRRGRGRNWRRGRTHALDARQQAVFVTALERGAHVAVAAREAGAALSTLYYRRRTYLPFAEAWAEAVAVSAAPVLVERANKRGLQKRRMRRTRFVRAPKQAFLDHFAATCDLKASAGAAGVCPSTVHRHLISDPAFADGFEEALKTGYLFLEAEAVRQQREAQQAYRIDPKGEAAAQSFERAMQLLREYKRAGGPSTSLRTGSIGRRAARRGDARSRWTFEEAMAALEKKLAHFGVEVVEEEEPQEEAPPPPCGRSPSPGNPGEELGGDGDA